MKKFYVIMTVVGTILSLQAQDVVNTNNLESFRISAATSEQLQTDALKVSFSNFVKGMNYLEKNPAEINDSIGSELYLKAKGIKVDKDVASLYSFKPNLTSKRPMQPLALIIETIGSGLSDFENRIELIKIYTNAYKLLPIKYQKGLPTPTMISNYTVAKLQTANQTIDEVFRSNLDGITAELESSSSSSSNNDEWIGDLVCDSEDGAVSEHGENEISDKCSSSEYAGNGLMKNNSFRMKEHLTCVKDQGDRGTCVAFAVVAGMETRASIEGNGKRNFSEQFAWYDAKVHYDWWNRYEYGTDIKSLVKGLYKDDRKVSMESDWQYNRSEDMKDYNSSTKKHADSCDGYYGEYCTNFAFQAKEEKVGRDWVYTRPGRGHDGRKIKDYDSFFNFLRKEHSLDKAISYISNKKPVVLGFAATNRFNNAGTSSSFIDYYSSDSEIGGHAVLLVGYIKNSNLPSSAPKGEEGGYFIAKNSWGTTNGDCGYYYLSYKYVRKQAHRMVAILD